MQNIDEILKKGLDGFDQEKSESWQIQMNELIKNSLSNQYQSCLLYQHYCKMKNFYPQQENQPSNKVKDIPYLTTYNFKRFGKNSYNFLSVPKESIHRWSISRGVSFDTSLIGRDQQNHDHYVEVLNFAFHDMLIHHNYDWSLFFLPPFPEKLVNSQNPEKLPHFNYYIEKVLPDKPKNRKYGIKVINEVAKSEYKRYGLDLETTQNYFQQNLVQEKPGIIVGYVRGIMGAILELSKNKNINLKVHPDTKVLTFGGWDAPLSPNIDPRMFRKQLSQILGIPEANIRDFYGFTETDAILMECEHHRKHLLPWFDAIVRDVETLNPIENGQKGLLNIINPLATSYAGISILQDDVVRISSELKCACGRTGKTLEIFGRAH